MSICKDCPICACGNFCLAGHNDDDYIPASKEDVIERLNKGKYPSYRDKMIKYLKDNFNIEYIEGMSANSMEICYTCGIFDSNKCICTECIHKSECSGADIDEE